MKILDRVIEVILDILVVGMVLGCFWQIVTRFILHNPSKYTEEMIRYMLIWLTMIGVPYAYGKDRHLSINLIIKNFKPVNELRMNIFIHVVVLLISVSVMVVGGILVTSNAAGQISPALQLPMQIYYVCVPISGALMVVYGIEKIIKTISLIKEAK